MSIFDFKKNLMRRFLLRLSFVYLQAGVEGNGDSLFGKSRGECNEKIFVNTTFSFKFKQLDRKDKIQMKLLF